MTNSEAREIIENRFDIMDYCESEKLGEALDMAIKALDQISHIKDRPCEACEFYKESGCSKWDCVFEEYTI